ncbi:glutathione S-transferase omega-1-like [Physella acuta]|uniref:glutathione S-transferase omega-1-like n=1 Tax=Physella acuta TaxID=109671 RepID=UPI0027DD2779|nr:glutathione S-transferase omega-1-like [Physella acuta]
MTQKVFAKGSAYPPLQPGVLRLYSMRFCPFAHRTRLVLLYKNIQFETINVDLKYKPEWLFDKNPLGLVPIVELDDKIVYESTATCEWLDDIYPQHRLQPSDPYTKAWDRILLEYFGKLTPGIYTFWRTPDNREKLIEEFHKHYKFYDDNLSKRTGPLFGGLAPSMTDFYLWPHLEKIPVMETADPRISISRENFPHLAAWFDAMCQVPAVKATSFDVKTHLHFLHSYIAGNPDYDFDLDE